MKSVYVVGDIHGCYDALMRLEDAIGRHAAGRGCEPFVVSVGDLIDRGPDSRQVVRHVMSAVKAGTWAAVAGNHEACLFETLFGLLPEARQSIPMPAYIVPFEQQFAREAGAAGEWREFIRARSASWLRQGGKASIESFGCDPEEPSSWLEASGELCFLAGLPLLWESRRTVVSHALAAPDDIRYGRRLAEGRKPVYDSLEHDKHVRGLLWSRGYASLPADPEKMHISGHTPVKNVARFDEQRRLMIDTACVYGNLLTAWCEDTDELVQVPGQECEA